MDESKAQLKFVQSGDIVVVEQGDVETVIPQIGKNVKILKGPLKGKIAKMKNLDDKNFQVQVELVEGESQPTLLKFDYESISKMNE